MGTDDLNVLLERIENLREMLQEVRREVKLISMSGCSKAALHTETAHDHEQRIRLMEVFVATVKGQAAVISVAVSAGIALLVSWLSK